MDTYSFNEINGLTETHPVGDGHEVGDEILINERTTWWEHGSPVNTRSSSNLYVGGRFTFIFTYTITRKLQCKP